MTRPARSRPTSISGHCPPPEVDAKQRTRVVLNRVLRVCVTRPRTRPKISDDVWAASGPRYRGSNPCLPANLILDSFGRRVGKPRVLSPSNFPRPSSLRHDQDLAAANGLVWSTFVSG